MTIESLEPKCLQCGRGKHEIPLISLEYQEQTYWICPQHLPLLIHNPARLQGKIPGAENLPPAKHGD